MSKILLHSHDWIFQQRVSPFLPDRLDKIDIVQVSIILLVLLEFENQTFRSIKTKLLEVPKSNFWSSLLRLLHMENFAIDKVINSIVTIFSTERLFTPFRNNIAIMGAAIELPYPPISNAIQGKKTTKTAPFYYSKLTYPVITGIKEDFTIWQHKIGREKEFIQQKMFLLGTQNLSAYIRKIAIDGYINVDHLDIKRHVVQLQRIGNSVNQIVKRMNQIGSLHAADVAEVKKILHDIWISERRLLLKMR